MYLAWHTDVLDDEWLKNEIGALSEPSLKATHFLRSNPKDDKLSQIYEVVRDLIVNKVTKHPTPVYWPEHIVPYRDMVLGRDNDHAAPFFLSEWRIVQSLNLDRGRLDDLADLIGGFWYVLRPDTSALYASTISRLKEFKDGRRSESDFHLRINCGLLRVSPLDHSPFGIPSFQLESSRSGSSNNIRINGVVYPHNEEIVFHGSSPREQNHRLGQIIWQQAEDSKAMSNARTHDGLLLSPNRSGSLIMTKALFIRVPLTTSEENAREYSNQSVAGAHSEHFEAIKTRARMNVKVTELTKLHEDKIVIDDDIDALIKFYNDRLVYYI